MDIRTTLLQEHSKEQTLKITKYIGNNEDRFAVLMDVFFNDTYRICQRAAWVVGHVADQNMMLVQPYLPQMVQYLDQPVHDAVRRNTLKILGKFDLPESLLGPLADKCFNFLENPKTPVAIRAHSMSILYNICKKEPELKDELQLIIQDHMPHSTAGFKSRGKRIIKALQKL